MISTRATARAFIGVGLASLIVSGVLLMAVPARADHGGAAVEAAVATNLSPEEFVAVFDDADLPGLGEIGTPPAITGDHELDTRIRNIGQQRGYRRRALPNRPLTEVDGRYLQPQAARGWLSLRAAAEKAGHTIRIVSAFRNEEHQALLYRRKAKGTSDRAIDQTLRVVAVPGYSKHHTGYAIDIAAPGGDHNSFGNSRAYAWMAADNFAVAKAHGWVPSYPDGSGPGGPDPEPWEFVWVGSANIICGNFEPTTDHRFCDTHDSDFTEDIDWLAKEMITTGCSPVRFCPDRNLTRAQAATLLWRYSGRPEIETMLPFVDVPADSYFAQAAQWMFSAGLTTGPLRRPSTRRVRSPAPNS